MEELGEPSYHAAHQTLRVLFILVSGDGERSSDQEFSQVSPGLAQQAAIATHTNVGGNY